MRKIILQEMMSLDGFMSGPRGEFDWPLADEEFERRTNKVLDGADTLLLGRNTYQMFAKLLADGCVECFRHDDEFRGC